MSVTLFIISFIIMMAGMVYLILVNMRTLPVVKAGKVTKICSRAKLFFGYTPSCIKDNGNTVNLANDKKMVIYGNSMKDYHLYDGQCIYVREFDDSEKAKITTHPVLVLRIIGNPREDDAQYKLRKFVGYVHSKDWHQVYENLQKRIRISEEEFINQCVIKFEKMSMYAEDNLIISETFDEDRNAITYSLHPINAIFGKVEYAL